MKGANALVVGMCIVFLAAVFAPLTVGENDSLHVVMVIDDRDYMEGDTITVELRVFDKGVLVNADGANDTVEVTMTRNWDHNNHIDIPLTNTGVGIYRGTYVVGNYDSDTDDHHLYFYYQVVRGTPPNQDNAEIEHYHEAVHIEVSEAAFSVNVNFEGQSVISARPGDTIRATVLAKLGTSPIGDVAFDGVVIRDEDDNEQNISTAFVSTGVCIATYTIPPVTSSGLYEIYAHPSIAQGAHGFAWINVNVLDVWYHKLSTYGETVNFEVCVADIGGQAVNGAAIVMHRQWSQTIHTLTTNASGKAGLSLTGVNDRALMLGYVLWSGYNQSIEGYVYNPQPNDPYHSGLDIIWRGSDYIMAPGASVTIPYMIFIDEEMVSRTIYYYVTAWGTDFGLMAGDGDYQSGHLEAASQVVAAGVLTSSNVGEFSFSFTTPSTQSLLRVVFEVPQDRTGIHPNPQDWDSDGNFYEEWPEHEWDDGSYFYVIGGSLSDDDDVDVNGGSFKPGEATSISVSMPVVNEDPTCVLWGVGEFTPEEMMSGDYDPEWASWMPGGTIVYVEEGEVGEFAGDFLVPAFIDADSISIAAGYTDADTGLPHFSMRTAGRASGINLMLLIVLVAVVVIVVVVAVVIKMR
jgi:hypothetical protein